MAKAPAEHIITVCFWKAKPRDHRIAVSLSPERADPHTVRVFLLPSSSQLIKDAIPGTGGLGSGKEQKRGQPGRFMRTLLGNSVILHFSFSGKIYISVKLPGGYIASYITVIIIKRIELILS